MSEIVIIEETPVTPADARRAIRAGLVDVLKKNMAVVTAVLNPPKANPKPKAPVKAAPKPTVKRAPPLPRTGAIITAASPEYSPRAAASNAQIAGLAKSAGYAVESVVTDFGGLHQGLFIHAPASPAEHPRFIRQVAQWGADAGQKAVQFTSNGRNAVIGLRGEHAGKMSVGAGYAPKPLAKSEAGGATYELQINPSAVYEAENIGPWLIQGIHPSLLAKAQTPAKPPVKAPATSRPVKTPVPAVTAPKAPPAVKAEVMGEKSVEETTEGSAEESSVKPNDISTAPAAVKKTEAASEASGRTAEETEILKRLGLA